MLLSLRRCTTTYMVVGAVALHLLLSVPSTQFHFQLLAGRSGLRSQQNLWLVVRYFHKLSSLSWVYLSWTIEGVHGTRSLSYQRRALAILCTQPIVP
ncbi:hypothetical protein BJV78DRAFT_1184792 [Lactifluus subvellereus]|nr:hypothetical protein BJV78DRAFT_1184792 [Lactifluus subvellereus]